MTRKPADMTDRPDSIPNLPANLAPPAPTPIEAVREGLRCLQLSGALFLRAQFSAPWSYRSAEPAEMAAMLRPGGRRVIMFHIFTEGRCTVRLDSGATEDLEAGDLAIFPFGDPHCMGDPRIDARPPPARTLMPPMPWGPMARINHGGGGVPASMVCGYLMCDDLPINPVLASLPPFVKVRAGSGVGGGPLRKWIESSIEYALHAGFAGGPDTGSAGPVMQRLPELLFIEALCEFVRQRGEGGEAGGGSEERGWIAALQDPIVGRALAGMHREPARSWTLQELGKRAGASRSVLDERFREYLGVAPMSYLTSWRLQLAGRQLRTSNATLAEIAESVGYGSEASFSRAFKRHVGEAPGEWRRGD
jgi:AraC-like DNA-binding protein